MISNIITIAIFTSFVLRSVTSDKAWDMVDIERAPRHRYKYNQPVDEIYASIPVAVIYDDKDIRDEKSLKNKHTGTDQTESSVKDPNVKDIDDIFVPFSRNVKDFKDEVVDTTSKSESNIDLNDPKIIHKDKNMEITKMNGTNDIFINVSATVKGHTVTRADQVTSKFESDNFSKDHENIKNTEVTTETTNEMLVEYTPSGPTVSSKNIKLLSHHSTKEIHIPVAIIYDTEAEPFKNNKNQIFVTSPTTPLPTTYTPRTGIDRNNKQRKQQKGFILRASSFNEEKVETTTSRKTKPQENPEGVQFENRSQSNVGQTSVVVKVGQTSVNPQKDHTSVIPQTEQKSITSRKVEVKSRTAEESVKSTNENSTKTGKKRRERDPVVPIIESKNEIDSQTGEFHYR